MDAEDRRSIEAAEGVRGVEDMALLYDVDGAREVHLRVH